MAAKTKGKNQKNHQAIRDTTATRGPPPSAGQETPEPMHGLRLIIKEEAMIISDQPSFPAVAELAKRGLLSQRHGNVTDHVLA